MRIILQIEAGLLVVEGPSRFSLGEEVGILTRDIVNTLRQGMMNHAIG